ncbi:MAG: glycosyltransferase family 9 protein [bacterium]
MSRIGVVNFTRMGDLIQCGPFLDGVRENSPESHLILIVLENFVDAARRLPMVDEVISFPLDRFIPHLDSRRISLAELYAGLEDFATLLRRRRFDYFYNLAHTRLSAALTWLLHVPATYGLTYDSSGHLLVTHPWINYYFYVTLNRTWNPFNLVEMYLPIAPAVPSRPRLKFCVLSDDERETAGLLSAAGVQNNSPIIAFQMGAADEQRRWPVAAFVELARQLICAHNAQILLLGTAEETSYSQTLIHALNSKNLFDVTGKTSMGTLGAVLKHCQVLVSNDTGTIHLAAAMETPTVGIYLGPAAAKDTGPYGDGHLLFEPQLPCAPCSYHTACAHCACHEVIQPSDVAAAVALQLGKPNHAWQVWDRPRLRIRRTQVTETGQLRLIPLARLPLDRQTLLFSFYRVFWPLLLGDERFALMSPKDAWACEIRSLADVYEFCDPSALLTDEDKEAIGGYQKIAAHAEVAVEVLNRELRSKRPSLVELREMILKLARCDAALAHIEERFLAWAPLAQFIRVLRGNVPDESPTGLAAACRDVYGTLVRGSQLLTSLRNEMISTPAREREAVHA